MSHSFIFCFVTNAFNEDISSNRLSMAITSVLAEKNVQSLQFCLSVEQFSKAYIQHDECHQNEHPRHLSTGEQYRKNHVIHLKADFLSMNHLLLRRQKFPD
jgi:hypothetical protein